MSISERADLPLESVVRNEQVRLLYGSTGAVAILLIGVVNAHVTTAVLWPLYPTWAILAWIALMDITAAARFWLWRRFRRQAEENFDATRWGRRFTLGITIFGCLWGLLASIALVTDEAIYFSLVIFILGGMTAGAAIREAAWLPAFYGFAAPAIVPVSIALFTEGTTTSTAMGIMLAVLALALLPVGRINNKWIVDNIRLRISERKLNDELRELTANLNKEIDERRRAAAAREQSEAKLAFSNMVLTAATEGSPDGILIVDEHAKIISYNQHLLEMWRIPHGITKSNSDEPLLAAVASRTKDPISFGARVRYLYDHPEEASYDRIELADGRVFDRHTRSLYDPAHNYLGRIWFFRDITARERAEVALRASEAMLKATERIAGIGGWDWDIAHGVQVWSDELFNILGRDQTSFSPTNANFLSTVHPADRAGLQKAIDATLLRDEPFDIQYRIIRPDEAERFIHARGEVTRDETGKAIRFAGTCHDVTQSTLANRALQERDALLHAVAESTSEFVTAPNLDDAIGKALHAVSETLRIDRVMVLEGRPARGLPPILRYAWHAPDITIEIGPEFFENPIGAHPDIAVWHAPLIEGKIVITHVRAATGAVKRMLEVTGVKTLLVVPIAVNGMHWGQVSLDSCKHERDWRDFEIEILKTLADLIGNAVERDRHVKELADANRIVQSTPTVLYRLAGEPSLPLTFVSHNIALFGYEAASWIASPHSFQAAIHPDDAKAVQTSLHALLDGEPPARLEFRLRRSDGTYLWVETHVNATRDMTGRVTEIEGLLIDINPRKVATLELERRDALLHAVAVSATEFASAPSLEEALPEVLEQVSHIVQLDRMVVVERPTMPDDPPILQYVWQSDDVGFKVDAVFLADRKYQTSQIALWRAPLREGKIVTAEVATATGDVLERLKTLHARTLLLVPIMIDGKYWGHVGFDNCKQERLWKDYEIEILRTLSNLIGNVIQRDRYVKQLADANRIVQNTPTVLYRLSGQPSLPVTYISHNITLFGYDPAALMVSPHFFMNIIHPDDVAKVNDALTAALEEKSEPSVIEYRMLTSQGAYRWIENRYTPIRDKNDRLIEIEGILIDITERKIAEEKIALLARTDPLTGLANRATFIERLRHAFAAARRGAPAFAVLYLDLDRFKDINDTLGHPVGDLLLKTVAERLTNCVREADTVARLGGDEFAVLQTDLDDTSDAGALATKIRLALAKPCQLNGNELHITASVGISTYAGEIAGPDDMLAQADLALYRAKEEGRDQYRFHSEELDREVSERVTLADELRMAVERNEFELYYQPQVELGTGTIVGMEALIRWNHPTRGMLKPGAFIPIAEKTGTITAIGQWVLEHACEQMSVWRRAGIAPATIAVNISLAQLKTANEFIRCVTDTLAKWGLAPGDLELDVTESMLAHATLAHNDMIERLQKLGIKIAIDDFGTKYSSLDYLKTYRVSRLKIPQPMIDAATHHPGNAKTVRAIMSIARELNIEVVAQGVETEAEWSFLTATSPTAKVQGYYFSEPVPIMRAEEILRRGRIVPSGDQPTQAPLRRRRR